MAATAGHRSCRSHHFELHIRTKNLKIVEDHPMNIHVKFGFMGKYSNAFFSETTNMIKAKLSMNVH
jgi:hypothetical protein